MLDAGDKYMQHAGSLEEERFLKEIKHELVRTKDVLIQIREMKSFKNPHWEQAKAFPRHSFMPPSG